MFKNTFQNGLLSIFFSCGANPLALWEMEVHNGHVKRVTDTEVHSLVLEIVSTNVTTTYIKCPRDNQYLGIKLPFMVMIVKNMKRYFSFEIMILDDKNIRRRFRISNFQSTTKVKPFCTTMPIGLSGGWNQIQFNLCDFTRRAYGTQYIETLQVQVNANVRLRRIYFAERLYTEEELPQDYKLYLPLEKKLERKKEKELKKEKSELKKDISKKVSVVAAKSKEEKVTVEGEEAPPPPAEVKEEAPAEDGPPVVTPAETVTGTETPGEPSEGPVSEAAESEALTERAESEPAEGEPEPPADDEGNAPEATEEPQVIEEIKEEVKEEVKEEIKEEVKEEPQSAEEAPPADEPAPEEPAPAE